MKTKLTGRRPVGDKPDREVPGTRRPKDAPLGEERALFGYCIGKQRKLCNCPTKKKNAGEGRSTGGGEKKDLERIPTSPFS